MNIALMSHDNKKELMVQFCIAYCGILSKHTVCATNRTGLSLIHILCYGEIYLNTRDYYNATLAVMTIPIAEMIRYWEEYDSFHQQYSTTDSPAFLPRYQHLLDVLTAKDYLLSLIHI